MREFFAGNGAIERNRTLFAVGDAKQSIFSFQRADPAIFARMRGLFAERIMAAKKEWRPVDLDISFRSVAPVLKLVDKVFEPASVYEGVSEGSPHHECRRVGEGGLVEMWPLIEKPEKGERDLWDLPAPQGSLVDPATRQRRENGAHHRGLASKRRASRQPGSSRASWRHHDSGAQPDRVRAGAGAGAEAGKCAGRRRRPHGADARARGRGPAGTSQGAVASRGRHVAGDRTAFPLGRLQ